MFVTLIVKCALPYVTVVWVAPLDPFFELSVVVSDCRFGLFVIAIRGVCGGRNAATLTFASSMAFTVAPVGGLPVAVAMFRKAAVTFFFVQL